MAEVFGAGPEPEAAAMVERERAIVGTDHCDVGGWLARKWRLPANIVAVIERHLEPDYRGEHWPLLHLISRAVDWAHAERLNTDEPVPLPDLSLLGISPEHVARVIDGLREKQVEIHVLSRTLAYG
jgi:hypothetical protein